MRIVGLIGPKSGGKDTVFELLRDSKRSHGKISFAGPLKEICSQVFNLPIQLLNDVDLKELPLKEPVTLNTKNLREIKHQCVARLDPIVGERILYNPNKASIAGLENRVLNTPREIMQIVGTDFIRDRVFGEWHMRAAFADAALAKLVKSGLYCVTDVRFVNELEFLQQKFGADFVPYYVERPEAEEKLADATHPSELEVKKLRLLIPDSNIIKNDGSLTDLEKRLKDLKLPEASTSSIPNAKGSKFKYQSK